MSSAEMHLLFCASRSHMQHRPSLQNKCWICLFGCFSKLCIAGICIQAFALYCLQKRNLPINSSPVGSYPSLFPFLPAFLPSLTFSALLHFILSLPVFLLYPPLPYPSLPSFPSFLASFLLTSLLLLVYFEIAIHAVATISIGSQVGCMVRWINGHGTYDITNAF